MFAAAVAAFLAGLLIGLTIWFVRRGADRREAEGLRVRIAEISTEREADREKLQWVDSAESKMREAFQALAGEALRSNAAQLTESARGQIDALVKPLSNNLTSLEEHVRTLESKREGAYGALTEQLANLGQMQAALQSTTTTLAQALRSPTVRGQWGELQLRRVVELAGMADHVDFEEQASGESGRPDMIVRLPNLGVLPIDAKVPLDSYLDAMETDEPRRRSTHLGQHAAAMKARVRQLGLKSYWEQFDRAPEFVVMFVPNEACLGAAFEKDPGLLEYAIENRVLITSPVNLLALLRTVAYGWQQHQVTENAQQIAREGRELHKRVATFFKHLDGLGDSLDKSVGAYNRAVRSLEGRLLPAARRFEEMGVASDLAEAPRNVDVAPRTLSVPTDDGSGSESSEEGELSGGE